MLMKAYLLTDQMETGTPIIIQSTILPLSQIFQIHSLKKKRWRFVEEISCACLMLQQLEMLT